MPYLGLDPELSRELALVMRETATEADGLGAVVAAALLLAQLESNVPERATFLGEDLDEVGVIVSTRVDIAEGLELDPVALAELLGLTTAQVNQALAAFDADGANPKQLSPFFDLRDRAEAGAEVLRNSFLGLPRLGQDPVLDEALEDLGLLLPAALVAGELDVSALTAGQRRALSVLLAAVGSPGGTGEFGAPKDGLGLGEEFTAALAFAALAKAFELDQRLASAAGLPTIEDIIFQFNREEDADVAFDERFAPLDEFLPALLVFEGEAPTDMATRSLTISFARQLGFTGSTFDDALGFLRSRRLLQKALIPGDFDGIDGPLLVWTDEGVNNALLAGRRNGVLNDETRREAEILAEHLLAGDGSGGPIELTEDQIKQLAALVMIQNGEDFLKNPQVQRQIISAINLIGQQASLDEQRRLFADSIEAFRSLAVVGAPAVTYRQLKAAVGPEVTSELGYRELTARSEKAIGKRPQFVSLINHWGIPGGDTLKLKKYKFSFRFDESGRLTKVRNKKLSRWKRFKNSVKGVWKALKQEWKDNPWGVIWEGVKIVAAVVLTVVPGTNAIGAALLYASLAVLAADTVYQAAQGNWMEALASGLSVATYGASTFGNVSQAGSWAKTVNQVASTGKKVLAAVEHGEQLIDAIDDGDVLGIIGSGAGVLANGARAFPGADTVGSTADLVASGAEFVQSGVDAVNAGIGVVDAIEDGDALGILSSSFNLVSAGLTAAERGGQFANSASAYGSGNAIDGTQLDALRDNGLSAQTIEDEYTNRVFSADTLNAFSSAADTAADLATVTNIGASVIDGDYLGAAQQGVQFLGSEVDDEQTRLALAAADKGLAVARMVETVYDGGTVDGGDLFNALFELGSAAGAAFAGPPEPSAPDLPVDPITTVQADGSILVDYNGDGINDALLTQQNGEGVIQVDLDGDGTFDASYTDSDGDGLGDTRYEAPTIDQPIEPYPSITSTSAGSGITVTELGAPVAIEEGQSLADIARYYGITEEELLRENPAISDPGALEPGQLINTPHGATPSSAFVDPGSGPGGPLGPPTELDQFSLSLGSTEGGGSSLGVGPVDLQAGVVSSEVQTGRTTVYTVQGQGGAQVSAGLVGGGVNVSHGGSIAYTEPLGGNPPGYEFDAADPYNVPPGATVEIVNDATTVSGSVGVGPGLPSNNLGVDAGVKGGVVGDYSQAGRVVTVTNTGQELIVDIGERSGFNGGVGVNADFGSPQVSAGASVSVQGGPSTSVSHRFHLDASHPDADALVKSLAASDTVPPGIPHQRVTEEVLSVELGGSVGYGTGDELGVQKNDSFEAKLSSEVVKVTTVENVDIDGNLLGSTETRVLKTGNVRLHRDRFGDLETVEIIQNLSNQDVDAPYTEAARLTYDREFIESYEMAFDATSFADLEDDLLATVDMEFEAELRDEHPDLPGRLERVLITTPTPRP